MHGIELRDEERRTLRPSGSPTDVFSASRIAASGPRCSLFLSLHRDQKLEAAFRSPATPLAVHKVHSGVKVPGLLLRFLAPQFRSSFGLWLRDRDWFDPFRLLLRRGPFPLPCCASPATFPDLHSPSGCLLLPDRSVQSSEPPVGPPCKCARSPFAPRLRFYF